MKHTQLSGTKTRGFWKGFFAKMCASLGCGALRAKCTAGPNIPGYFCFLGHDIGPCRNPFAKISDFSSRPWRNLPPTWVIHMAIRRSAHSTPIHMELGAFLKKAIQEIHVDRLFVGWSAGRHVDHPCGWQISPCPARKSLA